MSILIIGATGFIGKNLKEYFLREKYSFKTTSLKKENWHYDFDYTVKTVINLVGKAHDHNNVATEGDYYFANLKLTKMMFEVFLKSSAELFIHISSLAALEEFESSNPLTESDICRAESWYGKSKREAEIWLLSQVIPAGKKLIILRPPMVHGPGDKGNLGLLYRLISKGIPYPLTTFDNNRSFISIENFCFFITQIINKRDMVNTGIYHIADDQSISTKDIIEIIKQVTGRRILNLRVPQIFIKGIAQLGDVLPIPLNSKRLKKMTSDLLVSNDKIKRELGINKLPWTAKEGVFKTIESFKK